MSELFVTLLYQPFLNILLFFYWAVGHTPFGYDMGIAVILLTLVIRVVLLPVTLASDRSEKERREIQAAVHVINERLEHHPVERKQAITRLFRSNPRILFAEAFMFLIQLAIALVLWRIFAHGLEGQGTELIYPWMPEISLPYELNFLGRYHLSSPGYHNPEWQLNLLQSVTIFLLETIAILTSPYTVSRDEVVRVQFVLPVMSFIVFLGLPAGKKLFVITTLWFSIMVILLRAFSRWYTATFVPPDEVVASLDAVDGDDGESAVSP